MSCAVHCSALTKTYPGKPPVEAVRGIDLAIDEGECFGVLGPNGAGKTTTIEILEGLLEPSSGDVSVLGLNWRDHGARIRQQIGISLQETRFSDKLTVAETARLFRSFYPRGLRPDEVVSRVGLEEKSNAWVKHLSGGQRQRLAIAVALIGDPALLFLDEPTTGLDPHSRRQLWEIIGQFRSQGRTTLLTTHYMEEAERLCDRVAIVDHGRVIASGTPRELIAQLGGHHVVEFSLTAREGAEQPPSFWIDLPTVVSCRHEGMAIHLTVTQPHRVLPALVERLERRGWELASLVTRHASLDDVFVTLTGRALESDVDSDDEEEPHE
ncbi:MAG: ABC transporter ATP-binding protein [Pirellulaceae bacterium]|nr:ABC transporter ATP-binding protein [Pirellulaceae bacterium]